MAADLVPCERFDLSRVEPVEGHLGSDDAHVPALRLLDLHQLGCAGRRRCSAHDELEDVSGFGSKLGMATRPLRFAERARRDQGRAPLRRARCRQPWMMSRAWGMKQTAWSAEALGLDQGEDGRSVVPALPVGPGHVDVKL